MSRNPSQKIVLREVVSKIVQDLKQRGAVIVTTNGSFDLLHIGHVTMLQEAKALGDVLIVGVNSDASVKQYKGKSRPICPQEHRVEMLAALACTDYITIFDELTPIELLALIQPHIHVNSPEHGYECVEREVVERHGGRIYLARLVAGMSTSQLIERILEASAQQPGRAIFLNVSDLLHPPAPLKGGPPPAPPQGGNSTLNALKQFCDAGFRLLFLETQPEIAPEVRNSYRQFQEDLRAQGIEIKMIESLEQAAAEFDVSLAKSFLISAEMRDIEKGRVVNCKTIFLKKRTDQPEPTFPSIGPNYTVENFQEVVGLLLKK